jgi:hypothetical protein
MTDKERFARATRTTMVITNAWIAMVTKHSIRWFSHGIFVLRPHLLRHWAVQLLHVPRNGQIGLTRPRHASSGPLFLCTNALAALLQWQAAIYSASSERSFVLCVTLAMLNGSGMTMRLTRWT